MERARDNPQTINIRINSETRGADLSFRLGLWSPLCTIVELHVIAILARRLTAVSTLFRDIYSLIHFRSDATAAATALKKFGSACRVRSTRDRERADGDVEWRNGYMNTMAGMHEPALVHRDRSSIQSPCLLLRLYHVRWVVHGKEVRAE